MNFRVDLDNFRGPLDLLLYLVRRHEVEIVDIPIAAVTQQFLEYLAILEKLDVNAVGDFLEVASILIEIKSRSVLPQVVQTDEDWDDPRQELVQRLLEYKKFKDAANMLDERSRQWQLRFARLANDLPPRRNDPAERPIQEVELWDLVSALGRFVRDAESAKKSHIVYDDTPIHVHMIQIRERLAAQGKLALSELFQERMHKSVIIGVFLAILELVRHRVVRAEQNQLHGEIWIIPRSEPSASLDLSNVDNYDHSPAVEAEPRADSR